MKEIKDIKGIRRFGNLAHGVGTHYVVFTKKYAYIQRQKEGKITEERFNLLSPYAQKLWAEGWDAAQLLREVIE